ncbi:MAG: NAD(P)/FAD-dependent oxidoreductase, partial [Solirubrobacteraceae bacterium]
MATTIPPAVTTVAPDPAAATATAPPEAADVIVVGARCAGSATAIALARAGRRVLALDGARFPADTISTHLLWPSGVAELQTLGALARVRALGAPTLSVGFAGSRGIEVRGGYTPVDGIDHGMCVRRTGLDAALVDTAREAGAEVSEGTRVTDVLVEHGRAVGVRWRDRDDREGVIRASLVVGADGRRSTVARELGVADPYRDAPSGRSCFYAYWQDPHPEWRHVAAQWREGRELGTAFPCDGDRTLVLLQPPVDRDDEFRGDTAATYDASVAAIPGLADRLRGAERITPVRFA